MVRRRGLCNVVDGDIATTFSGRRVPVAARRAPGAWLCMCATVCVCVCVCVLPCLTAPPFTRQGLVHLHSLAIVHGDLKPANVLLDNDGRPRIADWGLSRVSQGFTCTSTPATIAGFTRGYAAPEVQAGQRTSFASDMCVSLGVGVVCGVGIG